MPDRVRRRKQLRYPFVDIPRKVELRVVKPNVGITEMLEHLLESGYMIGKGGRIISSKDGAYVVSTVGGNEILFATVEDAVKQFGQVV